MRAVAVVFAVGWGAFCVYWLHAAFSTKKGHVPWSRHARVRVVVAIVVIVLIRLGVFRDHAVTSAAWRVGLGLALFAVGLGFAVWARLHLGTNWGSPMTQKDDPDLVMTGPYRLVRHPIYSGILTAGIGTAVALTWSGLVVVAIVAVYFGYSATVEERFLAGHFPDTYPCYRRSTKMLIPFVY